VPAINVAPMGPHARQPALSLMVADCQKIMIALYKLLSLRPRAPLVIMSNAHQVVPCVPAINVVPMGPHAHQPALSLMVADCQKIMIALQKLLSRPLSLSTAISTLVGLVLSLVVTPGVVTQTASMENAFAHPETAQPRMRKELNLEMQNGDVPESADHPPSGELPFQRLA